KQVAVGRPDVPVREPHVVGGGEVVRVVVAGELQGVLEGKRLRGLLCPDSLQGQQRAEEQRHDRNGTSASMSLQQRGLLCRECTDRAPYDARSVQVSRPGN